jgi:guanylate kinase
VVGPSGVGKTSLVSALLESTPELQLSISYTTRPQRDGEIQGEDYHFVDLPTFERMRDKDEFLEHAEVFGHYYGTSGQWVRDMLAKGRNIVLEIDWQGAKNVSARMPKSIGIFILPPALQQLEARLKGRKQDNAEVIQNRLSKAREDMRHCVEADYLIVNSNFDTALKELKTIFLAAPDSEKLRIEVIQQQHASLLESLMGK